MTDEAAWLPEITREDLSRRRFLKWSAIAGGTAAVAGAGWKLGLVPIGNDYPAQASELAASGTGAKTVWSSCNVNCGSRCPLRLRVVDGQIIRIDPDNTGTNDVGSQQIRACLRGRSIRKRIYSPERLKYPMKRIGERGSANSPASHGMRPSTRSRAHSKRRLPSTGTRPYSSTTAPARSGARSPRAGPQAALLSPDS